MPYRLWLKLAAILAVLAIVAVTLEALRAGRRDRAQLTAELASTKRSLAEADSRQHDRDVQLAQTLAALEAQKRATVTPAQIVRELQKSIPLPIPLVIQAEHPTQFPQMDSGNASTNEGVPAHQAIPAATNANNPAPDGAFLPRADLKPLYDFTLDCQACQAKLSTAQNDLADEKTKTVALTKERDDALRIAKGGSSWRRVARAAKWFLLGAAAGAVAARTH